MEIFDITSPGSPAEISYYDAGDNVAGIYVSGKYAYLACGYSGLEMVDISNASSPSSAGYYNTKDYAFDVKADGNYIYVANFDAGLDIFKNSLITGIKGNLKKPGKFILYQNYPNPFNPSTTISFTLTDKSFVKLIIYDILGNKIQTLFSGYQSAGLHKVKFNAANLSSGVYLYSIQANGFKLTRKMLILK